MPRAAARLSSGSFGGLMAAAMRDRWIHSDFGVDDDLVQDIVTNKMPELHRAIEEIIEAEISGQ